MISKSDTKQKTAAGLSAAVHKNSLTTKSGLLERLFTLAFSGLVYPQIWEDPVVDMEALALRPGDHMMAIASGGCNVMSYLIADPASITAIDLNGAHVALNRLKICAAQNLPDYQSFYQFFGRADDVRNVALYDACLRHRLDLDSFRYWEGRTWSGKRRIERFGQNFYRFGLLGWFVGMGHFFMRLYGCKPEQVLAAKTMAEQRFVFDSLLAPIFDRKLMRWIVDQPAALYGLGIPPAQYHALAGAQAGGISQVLRGRLERLVCGFDLRDNYFAHQAFGRSYGSGVVGNGASIQNEQKPVSVPPYLEEANFEAVRSRASRIKVEHKSFTEHLASLPDASMDAYVLLDAQDWMNDAELTNLWTAITRTAKPGARVLFRTAAEPSLLPGRIPDDLLGLWAYDEERCRDFTQRDRSSIYGGVHLYTLKEAR